MKISLQSFLLAISVSALISCAQKNLSTEKDIIPSPVEIIKSDGLFTFKSGMSLYINT